MNVSSVAVSMDGKKKTREQLLEEARSELEHRVRELSRALKGLKELETVVNKGPAMVFVWRNAQGWPVELASDNIRQLGYTPEDFTSGRLSYFNIVHPEDRQKVADGLSRQAEHGEEELVQRYRVITARGKVRWAEARTWPHSDLAGRTDSYFGMVTDVSDSVRAEEAAHSERRRFEALCEHAPFAMLLLGKGDAPQYANPKFQEVFGYCLEEIAIPKDWLAKIFPDREYRRKVISDWLEYVKGAGSGSSEPKVFSVICKNGARKTVRFISTKFDSQDFLITCEDITEQHRTERALKESEQRLELALEATDLGLWDYNVQTGEVFRNRRWLDMLGYSPQEVQPDVTGWARLIHPADVNRVTEAANAVLEGRSSHYQVEHRMLAKSGEWKWIRARGRVIERGEDGSALRITGTHEDITDNKRAEDRAESPLSDGGDELAARRLQQVLDRNRRLELEIALRKRAEEQLKMALAEKDRLSREVHERLKSSAEFLSSALSSQINALDEPRAVKILGSGLTRLRAMALVHELVAVSQDASRIDFKRFLEDLAHALTPWHPPGGSSISVETVAQAVFLKASTAVTCGLIVCELFTNAVKHAFSQTEGGGIQVSLVRQSSRECTLTVSDNGKGLPENLDWKSSASPGLRYVAELAESHLQGRLELERGQGTTWKLHFEERRMD